MAITINQQQRIRYIVLILCLLYEETKANSDFNNCKVTHSGLSFTGPISKTREGRECVLWSDEKIKRRFSRSIQDEDFPERSTKIAKNFCRNPTKRSDGPWCYTNDSKSNNCDIPLCMYSCRKTGPGVEYSGTISKVGSDDCQKWNNKWRNQWVKLLNNTEVMGIKIVKSRFHKSSVDSASNYCRNPDGDLGGK